MPERERERTKNRKEVNISALPFLLGFFTVWPSCSWTPRRRFSNSCFFSCWASSFGLFDDCLFASTHKKNQHHLTQKNRPHSPTTAESHHRQNLTQCSKLSLTNHWILISCQPHRATSGCTQSQVNIQSKILLMSRTLLRSEQNQYKHKCKENPAAS